jgi:thioredoxin 1
VIAFSRIPLPRGIRARYPVTNRLPRFGWRNAMQRRTFNALLLAAIAAPFIAAGTAHAQAKTFRTYRPEEFKKLLASGKPTIVHIHADWCPVCRRQITIMNEAFKDPKYANVNLVRVNYDKDKQFLSDYKAPRHATIIVYRSGKEVKRISYDTDPERILAVLATAA